MRNCFRHDSSGSARDTVAKLLFAHRSVATISSDTILFIGGSNVAHRESNAAPLWQKGTLRRTEYACAYPDAAYPLEATTLPAPADRGATPVSSLPPLPQGWVVGARIRSLWQKARARANAFQLFDKTK